MLPVTNADSRTFEVYVAGPAALIVAKSIKINERRGHPDRLSDKDALDVLRLLQSIPTNFLAAKLSELHGDEIAGTVTRQAVALLASLFGTPEANGSRMAARAATPLEAEDTIRASCAALATDLLRAIRDRIGESDPGH